MSAEQSFLITLALEFEQAVGFSFNGFTYFKILPLILPATPKVSDLYYAPQIAHLGLESNSELK